MRPAVFLVWCVIVVSFAFAVHAECTPDDLLCNNVTGDVSLPGNETTWPDNETTGQENATAGVPPEGSNESNSTLPPDDSDDAPDNTTLNITLSNSTLPDNSSTDDVPGNATGNNAESNTTPTENATNTSILPPAGNITSINNTCAQTPSLNTSNDTNGNMSLQLQLPDLPQQYMTITIIPQYDVMNVTFTNVLGKIGKFNSSLLPQSGGDPRAILTVSMEEGTVNDAAATQKLCTKDKEGLCVTQASALPVKASLSAGQSSTLKMRDPVVPMVRSEYVISWFNTPTRVMLSCNAVNCTFTQPLAEGTVKVEAYKSGRLTASHMRDAIFTTKKTYQLSSNGMVLAVATGNSIMYYQQDYLGSTALVTNSSAAVVRSIEYEPFGKNFSSTGTAKAVVAYTGKEDDTEVGLYYYGARYYNPLIGRFISADSMQGTPHDPQSLNRYLYVKSSPMNYIDPDGHQARKPENKAVNYLGRAMMNEVRTPMPGVADVELIESARSNGPKSFNNPEGMALRALSSVGPTEIGMCIGCGVDVSRFGVSGGFALQYSAADGTFVFQPQITVDVFSKGPVTVSVDEEGNLVVSFESHGASGSGGLDHDGTTPMAVNVPLGPIEVGAEVTLDQNGKIISEKGTFEVGADHSVTLFGNDNCRFGFEAGCKFYAKKKFDQ